MPPKPGRPAKNLRGYLEALSRPVFQAGMSWRVIEVKWDGIREAFAGFEPQAVADFEEPDIDRLLNDPKVIRSKPKIEAVIHNARTLLQLDSQKGGFRGYLRSKNNFDQTVKDLKKQFRFIGDNGAYFFLHSVGEPVPDHHEWFAAHPNARTSRRPKPPTSS